MGVHPVIETPLVVVEEIASAMGDGRKPLLELALAAAHGVSARDLGGVIVATFSGPERFPALSVRIASALGLPAATPAFDLQMACSAYPYALYLAGRLSSDTGKRILVIDGDVQSRLVNPDDRATGRIFSDAVTASVVSSERDSAEKSCFAFYSKASEALHCPSEGPISMDGMKVFTFVATEVRAFLKAFLADVPALSAEKAPPFFFVPHQANPYMVRQLAKSLGLEKALVTLDPALLNPGSCSIPLALAQSGKTGTALAAGFGAGYSAAAAVVRVAANARPCG